MYTVRSTAYFVLGARLAPWMPSGMGLLGCRAGAASQLQARQGEEGAESRQGRLLLRERHVRGRLAIRRLTRKRKGGFE